MLPLSAINLTGGSTRILNLGFCQAHDIAEEPPRAEVPLIYPRSEIKARPETRPLRLERRLQQKFMDPKKEKERGLHGEAGCCLCPWNRLLHPDSFPESSQVKGFFLIN